MDTVVIVLLVLLGVIVLTKGKPLWSWMKEKEWSTGIIVMIFLIGIVAAFGGGGYQTTFFDKLIMSVCTVSVFIIVAFFMVIISRLLTSLGNSYNRSR